MEAKQQERAIQRLEPLIGEWSVEAVFPWATEPIDPGRTVFEWILGGAYVKQHTEIPIPEAPDSTCIVAADTDGTGFIQHYFDSRGVTRIYKMKFADGALELRRDEPDFSPLDFHQRYQGTLNSAGNVLDGIWQTSPGGENWEHDFQLTYRRAPTS